MCLLSFYPDGVMPDEKRLANGCDVNRDGFGFAIVTRRGELIVRKGLNADDMIDAFLETRAVHLDGPALFHSRWSTSGEVTEANCHPFQVGRDRKTVVAHNGVLFDPGKESLKSDTALFAEYMLPHYNIDKPAKRLRLERFLGAGNKLVILTVNPQRRRNAYIVNEDSGYWTADAEWHSNRDYEGWTTYGGMRHYATAYSFDDDWDDAWHGGQASVTGNGTVIGGNRADDAPDVDLRPDPQCEICFMPNAVDQMTMICRECGSCQDCGMSARLMECQCFMPTNEFAPVARLAIGN